MNRRAVIDIGTNSVKVLVADRIGSALTPVWEAAEQTRLGAGFYADGRLQPGPVAATAAAVARFVHEARERGADTPLILATSAARDASNPGLLRDAVREAAGLEVQLIGGATEAAWAFAGACSLPGLPDADLLVADVGGGSTELAAGRPGRLNSHVSLRLGAVRLLETAPPGDPPAPAALETTRRAARESVRDARALGLQPAAGGFLGVGVGGALAILARVVHGMEDPDRTWLDGVALSSADLTRVTERLWALPLAERRKTPGLPPERADVILGGAAIYEAVMAEFGIASFRVSTRGLRFGALLA